MKKPWKDYFDYWCPECENYILLERDNDILRGNCALCGLDISMSYETWKKQDKGRNE